MKSNQTRSMLLVASVKVLMLVGCSETDTRPAAPLTTTLTPTTQSIAEQPPTTSTTNTTQAGSELSLELAGMYGWDPENGFHNVELSGTLIIEEGCPYLDVTRDGEPVLTPSGEQLRTFLRLPEPRTRFDPNTGAVWVNGNGPMHTGTKIDLIGSEGYPMKWLFYDDGAKTEFNPNSEGESKCPAHISNYAASITPEGTPDNNTPTVAELPGLGLHAADETSPTNAQGDERGVLLIEPPCVYIMFTGQADESDGKEPTARRYFLSLRRPFVRYDADTQTLWYANHGPFKNGDTVLIHGSTATPSTDDGHEYRIHGCYAGGNGRTSIYGANDILPYEHQDDEKDTSTNE